MAFFDKLNKMHKNTDFLDTGLTKGAVFFFTLMVVKFWPELLVLDWYVYLIVALIFAIRPLYHFFESSKN